MLRKTKIQQHCSLFFSRNIAEKYPAGQGTVGVKGADEFLTNLRVNQSYVEEKTKANIKIIVQNVVKIHPSL